jgi:hypothetical protein
LICLEFEGLIFFFKQMISLLFEDMIYKFVFSFFYI